MNGRRDLPPDEGRGRGSAPLVTVAASAAAIVLWAWLPGGVGALLELTRGGAAGGELWRLFTGHLVHFSGRHVALDVAAFLALGWLCERRDPARTRWMLAAGACVVSAGVLALDPDLDRYRGLSGLATALMALLLVTAWRDAGPADVRRLFVGALGMLLALKLGYETLTSRALFAGAGPADPDAAFVAVPAAHWLGALTGLAAGFLRTRRRREPVRDRAVPRFRVREGRPRGA